MFEGGRRKSGRESIFQKVGVEVEKGWFAVMGSPRCLWRKWVRYVVEGGMRCGLGVKRVQMGLCGDAGMRNGMGRALDRKV